MHTNQFSMSGSRCQIIYQKRASTCILLPQWWAYRVLINQSKFKSSHTYFNNKSCQWQIYLSILLPTRLFLLGACPKVWHHIRHSSCRHSQQENGLQDQQLQMQRIEAVGRSLESFLPLLKLAPRLMLSVLVPHSSWPAVWDRHPRPCQGRSGPGCDRTGSWQFNLRTDVNSP